MQKPELPDLEHLPMDAMTIDGLNVRLHSRCDVCGKPRSIPGGHPKCAKVRQQFYRGK